jgi:hypothetical protein
MKNIAVILCCACLFWGITAHAQNRAENKGQNKEQRGERTDRRDSREEERWGRNEHHGDGNEHHGDRNEHRGDRKDNCGGKDDVSAIVITVVNFNPDLGTITGPTSVASGASAAYDITPNLNVTFALVVDGVFVWSSNEPFTYDLLNVTAPHVIEVYFNSGG